MKQQAKALVGGAIAALSYLVPVVDNGLLWSEGLSAALAFAVGYSGVYWTRNAAPPRA